MWLAWQEMVGQLSTPAFILAALAMVGTISNNDAISYWLGRKVMKSMRQYWSPMIRFCDQDRDHHHYYSHHYDQHDQILWPGSSGSSLRFSLPIKAQATDWDGEQIMMLINIMMINVIMIMMINIIMIMIIMMIMISDSSHSLIKLSVCSQV